MPLPGLRLPARAKSAPFGENAWSLELRADVGMLLDVLVLVRVPFEPTQKVPNCGKPLSFRYSCSTTKFCVGEASVCGIALAAAEGRIQGTEELQCFRAFPLEPDHLIIEGEEAAGICELFVPEN
jgi:hypothetical protein